MTGPVNPNLRSIPRPNSFIFTLFGDLTHEAGPGASLWIGGLIRLMAPFGLSPAAVRQAVSRMSRQGWMRAERRRNRAFYAITPRGQRRVAELSPRIYGPVIEWDGRWRLLAFAVPETLRERRERFRQELRLLGWAPLAPSIWISPADSLEGARRAAEANGLAGEAHAFGGEYAGPLSDRELVARCWNLEAIAGAYASFIERYASRLVTQEAFDDEGAFVERLWLLHDFRKLAYDDPGLPSELVPAHWPGTRAASIFRQHYAALSARARRYAGVNSAP